LTFRHAIDVYVADMRAQGRINSPNTERDYRITLDAHADDVTNRDPRLTNRDDVKRTLRRWPHPNSQSKNRSILVSFYDWTMEEGIRKDNPARQTRSPRRRPVHVYRLTRDETAAFLAAAITTRERRAAYLGVCAGLRNAELRGMRGVHFQRPGWVWVSSGVAKGGRERWVPVLPDLEPIVAEIRAHVAGDEYVLPAERWRDPGANTRRGDLARRPSSSQALRQLVMRVAARAGIKAHVHPHVMRHAFGDHVARYAGMRNAQFLLGHATVGTTEAYVGDPTLDELAAAIDGLTFTRTSVPPPALAGSTPLEAPTGIEPVASSPHGVEPSPDARLLAWMEQQAAHGVRVYRARFEATGEAT
jgi:site-specific recombinase XerD